MGHMKQNIMIGILIAVVVVAVVAYFAVTMPSATQAVKAGDNVSVYYTGTFTNGTVFNTNVGSQTFNFTVGANEVIPGFDQAVIGMRLNQNKTVTVPVNEAYGPVNPALIVALPLSEFGNQTIQIGMIFTQTTASGQELQGIVTAVNSTNATLDFNPPLAGHELVFTIKVVKIQKGP